VDYIEPSYIVTVSTTPPATIEDDSPVTTVVTPITTDSSSVGTATTTDSIAEDGSGATVTPEITNPPTVTPPVKCGKIRGGALLKHNNYLIMFRYDIPAPQMNRLYALLKLLQTLDSTFHMDKMKNIFDGPVKGFYYDGLGELAVMKVRVIIQ